MKQLCTLLNIDYRRNLYEVCEEQLLGIDGRGFLHRAVAVPEHALAIIFDDDYSLAAAVLAAELMAGCRIVSAVGEAVAESEVGTVAMDLAIAIGGHHQIYARRRAHSTSGPF